jgi:hypothetical protein
MDEADKMLDMGFMPQIRAILEIIPVKRQNLLFSATFNERIERLSQEFLEFPEKIEIAPQATTAETIQQVKYYVPNIKTKINLLEYLFSQETLNRVIVFTKSKKNAEAVYHFLERRDLGEVKVIHANKGQNTRINSMDLFKAGEVRILVATDVAARGLDITEVSHVINFDVPLIYEDYVHHAYRAYPGNIVVGVRIRCRCTDTDSIWCNCCYGSGSSVPKPVGTKDYRYRWQRRDNRHIAGYGGINFYSLVRSFPLGNIWNSCRQAATRGCGEKFI